jgi:ATP-binding cassette subfamily B multidrug efflux pump
MFKLFKLLKPYKWVLLVIALLVTGHAMANLVLPDRMSVIIGEGIKIEPVYETTAGGEEIYVGKASIDPAYMEYFEFPSGFDFSGYSGEMSDIRLPAFALKDEGKLVTKQKEGRHYAIIIGLETDSRGNIIRFTNPMDGSSMPVPRFLRTEDGAPDSTQKQGRLILGKDGNPEIFTRQVSDKAIILKYGLQMLAISLIGAVCSIGVAYFSSRLGNRFGRDIRSLLFDRVLSFSQSQEDKFSTSGLITRSTNDVTQIQMILIQGLRMMLMSPIMFFGGLIMSLLRDVRMTLLILAGMPLIILLIIGAAKVLIPLFKIMQQKIDRLTLVAREGITGVRVIRAYGAEKREGEKFERANRDLTEVAIKQARIMSVLMPFMTVFMSFTTIAILIISVLDIDKQLGQGNMDFNKIADMMAITQYVMQIMFSLITAAMIFIIFPRAVVSAARINEVMDEPVPQKADETLQKVDMSLGVEFDNVTYTFEGAENPAVSGVSFTCTPGSVTAIVGSTGSGKSTLINLLPRIYDATEGEVKIGGVNVKELDTSLLRRLIGFAPQNAGLISGTIRSNILYGAEDLSEENMISAARIAQAEGFILEKEKGYDSVVEQNGANFSGGQKQRLSIARAIAKRAPVLIFDDSFSALDFTTDAKLRKALGKELKGVIQIIVAQRIGTIMNADNIIMLHEGKPAGQGTHRQLLVSCPEYRALALSQMSEEELSLKEAQNG